MIGAPHQETYWIEIGQGDKEATLHMKRLYIDQTGPTVLMVHGSMENGGIFYSHSMKGLGPFLARQGYDVYIVDLRGKGKSTPPVSKASLNTQLDSILEEIPSFILKIRDIRGSDVPMHAVAHSWGGVLLLSYLARFSTKTFSSCVFLGTKRSIAARNLKKFLAVDIAWRLLGEISMKILGYLPTKIMGMGVENEPRYLSRDNRKWVVNTENWIDPEDGFDYIKALRNREHIPPTLYLGGPKDPYLGNPIDIKRLIDEVQNPHDRFLLLSRGNGYHCDYGHIDMCTSPLAEEEHFPQIIEWMENHSVTPLVMKE